MIEAGMKGIATCTVVESNTAAAVGSGLLPVFSTPSMIALMECAACDAIAAELEEGMTSVGTKLDVSHDAATPMGMEVRAEAELTKVEGRHLFFTVRSYDEAGLIGQGLHERFIVHVERFLQKTNAKK